MEHIIKITTVEALLINKALRMDLHNEVDNQMAKIVVDRINDVVTEDLRKNEEIEKDI